MTLRIVAEQADVWHTFGSPEVLAHKATVLADWCTEVGRDPGDIERSVGIDYGRVTGDPIELAEQFHAVGITQFTFGLNGPDYDFTPVKPWLKWRDEQNG